MNFEVEIKFRNVDHGRIAHLLAERGHVPGPPTVEVDHYVSHPCRDFLKTDEVLRLRREDDRNILTYKGPKLSGPVKTRREIEAPLADGILPAELMLEILHSLGFAPVSQVRKARIAYQLTYRERPVAVVLDRVEGLGDFAEVEMIAAEGTDLSAAREAVLALAAELGLTEVEPRSYIRMVIEAGLGASS